MKLTLQKKKSFCPIKASKKKPATELQRKKNMPGSSFRHKMKRSFCQWPRVSGSSCLLQNCPHCSRMILSPPVQQFFPPTVSRSNVKTSIHHLLSKQREWTRSHLHQTESALDTFIVRTGPLPLTHVWVLSGLMESF